MAPEKSHFLVSALTDMMFSFRLLNTTQTSLRDSYMKKHDMELSVWMDLFSPSLDWFFFLFFSYSCIALQISKHFRIPCVPHPPNNNTNINTNTNTNRLTQCLAPVQTKQAFDLIMRKYEDHQEGLVLHHIIQKFKASFLAPEAFSLLQLINKAQVFRYIIWPSYFNRDFTRAKIEYLTPIPLSSRKKVETYPKFRLLAELGEVCVHASPPKNTRQELLKEIWTGFFSFFFLSFFPSFFLSFSFFLPF